MRLTKALCIYVTVGELGLLVGLLTREQGCLTLLPAFRTPFLMLGCLLSLNMTKWRHLVILQLNMSHVVDIHGRSGWVGMKKQREGGGGCGMGGLREEEGGETAVSM